MSTVNLQSCNSPMSHELLLNGLLHIYNNHIEQMLTDISNEHNLDLEQLKEKYIEHNNIDFNIFNKKRPRKKNKTVTKDDLCMARKADTHQCTRRRKPGSDFCGKHAGNLKHGRIDDADEYSNNEKFIQCSKIEISGKEYLIDDNNIIYTNNVSNPTVLGKLTSQGQIINDTGSIINTE